MFYQFNSIFKRIADSQWLRAAFLDVYWFGIKNFVQELQDTHLYNGTYLNRTLNKPESCINRLLNKVDLIYILNTKGGS